MSTLVKFVFRCDGSKNGKPCTNHFDLEGEKVTKRQVKLAARKAGWLAKSSKQVCPSCRPVKAAKKASVKKAAKALAKKVVKAAAARKLTEPMGMKKALTAKAGSAKKAVRK